MDSRPSHGKKKLECILGGVGRGGGEDEIGIKKTGQDF